MNERPVFPKGNRLWKERTKHGRDKIFSDPTVLLAEAYKYFELCDDNPLRKAELVKYKGTYEEASLPCYRLYSICGLMRFLNVSVAYFRSAKSNLRDKIEKGKASDTEVELLETIESIENTIRAQQIEGAAAGLFNAGIVARLNGLAEHTNVQGTGETVLRVSVRDEETAAYLRELEDLL